MSTGVFDYAESKKNRIEAIRPRFNGAWLCVFTLAMQHGPCLMLALLKSCRTDLILTALWVLPLFLKKIFLEVKLIFHFLTKISALICFDNRNFKSCDVFTGSTVISTCSTSYSHKDGGLGFYNGQPITVGSVIDDGFRRVETLSSSG